jgi:MerR family transcriptional regulator, light-induced transcriptional regulator
MSGEAIKQRLIERLNVFDRHGAVEAAAAAVEAGEITVSRLYLDVLAPILRDIGLRWRAGTTTVWQEHLISGIVRTVIENLEPEVVKARKGGVKRPSVVLACGPEEHHEMGLRMLSDLFELRGYRPYFLGADTPVEEIVTAAGRLKAEIVVLSASTHFHRVSLRAAVVWLKKEMPQTRVLVTGAAFGPEPPVEPFGELLDPRKFFDAEP